MRFDLDLNACIIWTLRDSERYFTKGHQSEKWVMLMPQEKGYVLQQQERPP